MAKEVKTESAEKMVTIFIPRDKDSKEASMFVSVNDRTFYVPIGKKVEVPECVANVINTSQEAQEEIYQRSLAQGNE